MVSEIFPVAWIPGRFLGIQEGIYLWNLPNWDLRTRSCLSCTSPSPFYSVSLCSITSDQLFFPNSVSFWLPRQCDPNFFTMLKFPLISHWSLMLNSKLKLDSSRIVKSTRWRHSIFTRSSSSYFLYGYICIYIYVYMEREVYIPIHTWVFV